MRIKNETEPLVDFVVDWDSPQSRDAVLRKKFESGEELAVSALCGLTSLLDEDTFPDENRFNRVFLIKVCIKKAGLSSILQFDCEVTGTASETELFIQNVYYLQSETKLGASLYRGPLFSTLDLHLQDELKQYLVKKGIDKNLTDFLDLHLR